MKTENHGISGRKLCCSAVHTAKTEMTKTVDKYLNLPHKEREGAAHIIELTEATTIALDLSKKDNATSLTMLNFA